MLHEFLGSNRSQLLSRTRPDGAGARPAAPGEPESGIPLFLTQVTDILRLAATAMPLPPTAIGEGAAHHGGELLANGSTLARVVHDYGAACQAIADLAVEEEATITPEEFHTLTRCLEVAVVEAVTEYGRLKEEAAARRELDNRGRLAHDLRNLVQTALLSFQVLESGKVAASASARGVLGRSLVGIRDLAETIVPLGRVATIPRDHDGAGVGLTEPVTAAGR